MIEKLIIKNVALIDHAEIDFSSGLNVLSGETGAGKSVILDSINFVLGAKADKSMIRYGETECSVQAVFSISDQREVKEELNGLDVEYDDTIIISRKFSESGKSSIKLNGMPVNAAMLRKITSYLVDVHGQSEHFFLLKEANQLKVLDRLLGEEGHMLKEQLRTHREAYRNCLKSISALGGDSGERERKIDVLRFQIEEIESASLQEGEEEELLAQRDKMIHAEKIIEAFRAATEAFSEENGIIDRAVFAVRNLSSVSKYDEQSEKLSDRLESFRLEAEDLEATLSDISSELYFDQGEANRIEERLDLIKLLKRKYGSDVASILSFLKNAKDESEKLLHCDEELQKLEKLRSAEEQEIFSVCKKLTQKRKAAAAALETKVIQELKTLNIRNASFVIRFEQTECDASEIGAEGADGICFLFSANAGEPLKELGKIISGGEMSRFMLALKTQFADINGIETYIFDEIDAGISGITATVVAQKFAQISRKTQIIAVSHLAQIASMSDREFLIKKIETDGKTHTEVCELNEKNRIDEIVRLIGGNVNSASARAHAEELLQESKKYKQNLL